MELTFRQKTFLSKLLDLYHEMREPVHYSLVAERLGLSSSTAYDMLRLLEQKGMVSWNMPLQRRLLVLAGQISYSSRLRRQ